MCLGIPGQLVEFLDDEHLAKVDVAGVRRTINVGLLEDERLEVGDWVLIHVGFAMSKIDEDEARVAMDDLQRMGRAYEEEVAALSESGPPEGDPPAGYPPEGGPPASGPAAGGDERG